MQQVQKTSGEEGHKSFYIVLDLDETLIYARADHDDPNIKKNKTFEIPDGSGGIIPVIIRPYFHEFLRAIRVFFDDIFIFTAAEESYAKDVVAGLFGTRETGGSLYSNAVDNIHIWSSRGCNIIQTHSELKVYKDLTTKISKNGKIIDTRHTMVIDDRSEVSDKNRHARDENHIVIKPFHGDPEDDSLLQAIERIKSWKSNLLGIST